MSEYNNTCKPEYYIKKPIPVQAIQWVGDNQKAIKAFCDNSVRFSENNTLIIDTLEGTLNATIGDYIVKGVEGEFYPCSGRIFESTYYPCTDESLKQIVFTIQDERRMGCYN